MNSKYKPVTHVILTLDGLLMNTVPTMMTAVNEIAASYNKGPIPINVQNRMLGRTERDLLNLAINELRLPIRFPLMQEKFRDLTMPKYKKCTMMTGAERIICYLTKNGIPFALTSSGTREAIDAKFYEYKGLFQNIKYITVGTDDPEIPVGKPNPTIFKVCASRFDENPAPESCLVFEDSPAGVAAACCAEMQVIMVPDPELDPTLIKDATIVLKSLADFKPELFGLPPMRS